ncbi:hypothetical protein ACI2KR_06895 [Pseudomonas luteola]
MNRAQFEIVNKEVPVKLTINEFADKSDRTLIYGYTCDRDTFHMYIKNGQLHTLVYSSLKEIIKHVTDTLAQEDMVPNKRVYPELSDFEACMAIKKLGVYISFTTFDEHRIERTEGAQFRGLTHDTIAVPPKHVLTLYKFIEYSNEQLINALVLDTDIEVTEDDARREAAEKAHKMNRCLWDAYKHASEGTTLDESFTSLYKALKTYLVDSTYRMNVDVNALVIKEFEEYEKALHAAGIKIN